MSMTVTVQCPSCQASYQAPAERAGAHFKCKKCGETLTVPQAPAATPERPVVQPVRPVVQPAKPVVQPARPVVQPAQPVVQPAKPVVEAARPVVQPAAPVVQPAKPAAARPPRPRVAAAPPAAPAKKSNGLLIGGIIGGVVILGAIGYFVLRGDSSSKKSDTPKKSDSPTAAPVAASKPSEWDATKRSKEIKASTGADSAGQLWALAQKLDAEAKEWREKGAPGEACDKLIEDRDSALEDLFKLSPDHALARAMHGEVKYDNQLDPFFDQGYLTDSERELVRLNRVLVNKDAAANTGWIRKTSFDTLVQPLVEKLSARQAEAESRNATPFGQAAKKMEQEVISDTIQKLKGKASFRAFIHYPYLICVEEDPAWSPSNEATLLFSPLKAIHEAFLNEFGKLGLRPLDSPVPVVFFKSEDQYKAYNEAIGNNAPGVLAHYEPGTGRLALNRSVSHETTIHEGTHQLFDKYTLNKIPMHDAQSFWFQEGIAEWFGGSNRNQDKVTKAWTYETGVLLEGRLGEWRTLEESQFTLSDLLDQTYAKRNGYLTKGPEGQKKIGLVYAQGWFLIYFLNHFNVDDKGFVQIGAKGKYADGWAEYLKAELTGKTGKKVFMECLKLDDAALEKMDTEFKQYFHFVVKKQNIGHVKEKKLLKWDEYVNKLGKKTGEQNDDLLVENRNRDK